MTDIPLLSLTIFLPLLGAVVILLIKEDKRDNALKLITETFEKLLSKGPYEMFDYAEFLKNNDQFEKSNDHKIRNYPLLCT